jgi:hypothetical protein
MGFRLGLIASLFFAFATAMKLPRQRQARNMTLAMHHWEIDSASKCKWANNAYNPI